MPRARSLDSNKLVEGEWTLHFSPATLHTMDTVHKSEEDAIIYMNKLASKQLHWQASIFKVIKVVGCSCVKKG